VFPNLTIAGEAFLTILIIYNKKKPDSNTLNLASEEGDEKLVK